MSLADRKRWAAWASRLRECSPWTDRPRSLAEIERYTRAGGWVPGDHPKWVEAPGYAYGYVIALPLSALGYAGLWVLQRPSRVFVSLVVFFCIWLAVTFG